MYLSSMAPGSRHAVNPVSSFYSFHVRAHVAACAVNVNVHFSGTTRSGSAISGPHIKSGRGSLQGASDLNAPQCQPRVAQFRHHGKHPGDSFAETMRCSTMADLFRAGRYYCTSHVTNTSQAQSSSSQARLAHSTTRAHPIGSYDIEHPHGQNHEVFSSPSEPSHLTCSKDGQYMLMMSLHMWWLGREQKRPAFSSRVGQPVLYRYTLCLWMGQPGLAFGSSCKLPATRAADVMLQADS